MSSRTLRRVLAGILVAASLSLGGPVSGEAAGFFATAEEPSFWALAWQWLTEQIVEEPAESVQPATAGLAESRGDAGWIIDPDG
jgi:hypothetical protein